MKRILIVLAVMAMVLPSCGQNNNKKAQTTDENASVVYFTKDISPEGLLNMDSPVEIFTATLPLASTPRAS